VFKRSIALMLSIAAVVAAAAAVFSPAASSTTRPDQAKGIARKASCNATNMGVITFVSGTKVSADASEYGCTVQAGIENNSGLGWSSPFNLSYWATNWVDTSDYQMSCGYNIYYSGAGRVSGGSWTRDGAGSTTC
jgi:hypothetical protein